MHSVSAAQQQQRAAHPCFVLELKCSFDSLDYFVEKDKSVIHFADAPSVLRCLRGFLLDIFERYAPDLIGEFDDFWNARLLNEAPFTVCSTASADESKYDGYSWLQSEKRAESVDRLGTAAVVAEPNLAGDGKKRRHHEMVTSFVAAASPNCRNAQETPSQGDDRSGNRNRSEIPRGIYAVSAANSSVIAGPSSQTDFFEEAFSFTPDSSIAPAYSRYNESLDEVACHRLMRFAMDSSAGSYVPSDTIGVEMSQSPEKKSVKGPTTGPSISLLPRHPPELGASVSRSFRREIYFDSLLSASVGAASEGPSLCVPQTVKGGELPDWLGINSDDEGCRREANSCLDYQVLESSLRDSQSARSCSSGDQTLFAKGTVDVSYRASEAAVRHFTSSLATADDSCSDNGRDQGCTDDALSMSNGSGLLQVLVHLFVSPTGKKLRVSGQQVERADLDLMMCIGQADDKFLLSVNRSSGVLFVLDQHAVDERIRLESFLSKACPCRSLCQRCFALVSTVSLQVFDVPTEIIIEDADAHVLQANTRWLNSWNFNFTESVDNPCGREMRATVQKRRIVLSSSPVIVGEPLTSEDFVEYLRWLRENPCTPHHMNRPPAVHRILCSKACRSAVRFGESLAPQQCADLVRQLGNTELPFQCAHGRPSCAPLGNILTVLDARRQMQLRYRRI
jgi:DNA mismatch repair ATPase MutL